MSARTYSNIAFVLFIIALITSIWDNKALEYTLYALSVVSYGCAFIAEQVERIIKAIKGE